MRAEVPSSPQPPRGGWAVGNGQQSHFAPISDASQDVQSTFMPHGMVSHTLAFRENRRGISSPAHVER